MCADSLTVSVEGDRYASKPGARGKSKHQITSLVSAVHFTCDIAVRIS